MSITLFILSWLGLNVAFVIWRTVRAIIKARVWAAVPVAVKVKP